MTAASTPPFVLLIAEDDPDDRLLVSEALEGTRLGQAIRFVADGEELMDYLRRRGRYRDPETAPAPRLVLLDLNMPRKDGREVLAEIKADPALRHLPVVAFSTSRADADVRDCYALQANGFISKPPGFRELVETMRRLELYWLDTVTLPAPNADE